MACYLGQSGAVVELHEKRFDPRKGTDGPGKSINLALSTRGLHALQEVGIQEEILKSAIPMPGRMIHSPTGDLTFQPYGKDASEVINSVSRGGLNCALLDAAEKLETVSVFFDHRCEGADLDAGTATLKDSGGGLHTTTGASLIGADGAFSAVRGAMQKSNRFDYSQDFLEHGYKELAIPAAEGGGFRMEKNALHIWPRGKYMMIALPNQDGSFTCTLFWPFDGPNSFSALTRDEDVLAFFKTTFPDAVPLMPTLLEDYKANPVGSLVTVRAAPWHYKDKVVLLGDAAHAVVPFLGQGMNASFEDCSVLNACLKEHKNDRAQAFADYSVMRKKNTDALADLAIANFKEMRDHTASSAFLLKKTGERVLARLFPGFFIPLYSLITFTNTPYAEAVERAANQNRVIRTALIVLIVVFILLARCCT
ncbi:MAG: kynurenine 3-monooxygenase [Elusimicrobia bacterium]|nr:MAG: kynurenine 3-monooxygenase [Elusimicrobiota bacterium]